MSQFATHMMRDAFPADAGVVSAIYLECFATTLPARLGRLGRWWSRRVWARRLAEPASLSVIAVRDGHVAGFAYATAARRGMSAIHTLSGIEWVVIPPALVLKRPRATWRRIRRMMITRQESHAAGRNVHGDHPDAVEPLIGWIEPYAVASFAQGQSLGRRLVRTIVERAAERGWGRVKAQVDRLNVASIHAMRRVGHPEIRTTADSVYFTFDPAELVRPHVEHRSPGYRRAA
jgi:L-amino acid N-acyltransferase YncA